MKEMIQVLVNDIEFLSEFKCEHYKEPDNCYNHIEQGGGCNSCWVKSWAEKVLKGRKTELEMAIKKAFNYLSSLTKEELDKEVEEHKDGDIAKMLQTLMEHGWNPVK